MAKTKRRKKGFWKIKVIIAILAILTISLVGFGKFIKTPGGKVFLLDLGFTRYFSEVQRTFDDAIRRVLIQFDALSISATKAGSSGQSGDFSTLIVMMPEGTSMIQLNEAITKSVKHAGGRVWKADEIKGRRGLRMTIGTRKFITHKLNIQISRKKKPIEEKLPEKPLVAIVVDDFGYFNNSLVRGFLALKVPFTITIIPGLEFSSEIARKASEAGREYLCHLPMEPEGDGYSKESYIKVSMSKGEIKRYIEKALESVPGAVGINNHMGSKATADERTMKVVLSICKERGLFFIDSMTSPRSVAGKVAEMLSLPCLHNDLFLDNRGEDVKVALGRLVSIAKRRGYAVGIMHARKKSLVALKWFINQVEKEGVEMVNVSRLIEILHAGEKEERK